MRHFYCKTNITKDGKLSSRYFTKGKVYQEIMCYPFPSKDGVMVKDNTDHSHHLTWDFLYNYFNELRVVEIE